MARIRSLEIPACPFANLPEARSGRWGEGLTAEKINECVWVQPESPVACAVRGLEGRDGGAGGGATRFTECRPPRMGMFQTRVIFRKVCGRIDSAPCKSARCAYSVKSTARISFELRATRTYPHVTGPVG